MTNAGRADPGREQDDAGEAARSAIQREFDRLLILSARSEFTADRFPHLAARVRHATGRAVTDESLGAAVNRMIDRLPDPARRAGRYLWGVGEERAQLSVAARRSAAAQSMSFPSWTVFQGSATYHSLRDQVVEIALAGSLWSQRASRRPRRFPRRVPLLALTGVVAALLAIPTESSSVLGYGYRAVRSLFVDEKAERSSRILERIESLHLGMSRAEMIEVLGSPFAERPVRENPFGVDRRVAFTDFDNYAVVALLNEAGSSVYYSVTALSRQMNVRIPEGSGAGDVRESDRDPRLVSSPLAHVDCDRLVVGMFGASWQNFALACGGAGADDYSFTFVGWNLYSSISRYDAVRDAELAVNAPSVVVRHDARALCLDASDTLGPEWEEDSRVACEASPWVWTEDQVEDLKQQPAWQRAQRRSTVDTFAVTAPTLVNEDSFHLFVHVMNGPGPCRSELDGGSAGCAPWY